MAMTRKAKLTLIGLGSAAGLLLLRRPAAAAAPGTPGEELLTSGGQRYFAPPPPSGVAPSGGDAAARGNAVTQAYQQGLQQLGYDPGPLDGRMGPLTRRAILDFQTDYAIPRTQTLDVRTKQAIDDAVASISQPIQSPTTPAPPTFTPGAYQTADAVEIYGSPRSAQGWRRY